MQLSRTEAIRAALANGSGLYGQTSITGAATAARTGLELNPGEGVTLKIDQLAKVFAFATTGPQKISYVAT